MRAAAEDTRTIDPPVFSMAFVPALTTANAVVKFVATVASHSASLVEWADSHQVEVFSEAIPGSVISARPVRSMPMTRQKSSFADHLIGMAASPTQSWPSGHSVCPDADPPDNVSRVPAMTVATRGCENGMEIGLNQHEPLVD